MGSMRRPLICGKHESDIEKMTSEGGLEGKLEEEKGRKEATIEAEEARVIEEAVAGDDFRYSNRAEKEVKGSKEQERKKGDETNAVEEDDLSNLGEEIEEEEGLQVGETKDDQPGTSEEEEWSETVLGEEARMIKIAFSKERVEELESKDSKAESKRRAKLAVQEKREEEIPEK